MTIGLIALSVMRVSRGGAGARILEWGSLVGIISNEGTHTGHTSSIDFALVIIKTSQIQYQHQKLQDKD